MLKITLFAAASLALGAIVGCNPPPDEGEAFIEGALPLVGPQCTVNAQDVLFASTALLDIGNDPDTANNLILPLKVRTNLPSTFTSSSVTQDTQKSPNFPSYGSTDNNITTFNESEVFFSTDEDRGAQLALDGGDGTPVNRQNARVTTVSGVAFNEQSQLLTPGVVFTTAITKGDAGLLQGQEFVANSINAGGFAHIVVNVRLVGTTTGATRVETPVFPFPVDLCQGCLTGTPTCLDNTVNPPAVVDAVPNDQLCVVGVDEPLFVCP